MVLRVLLHANRLSKCVLVISPMFVFHLNAQHPKQMAIRDIYSGFESIQDNCINRSQISKYDGGGKYTSTTHAEHPSQHQLSVP